MESLHVIIADRSQLVRMGITAILYQIGFALNIREISDAEKLKNVLQKEHANLLIISATFMGICPTDTLRLVLSNRRLYRLVLINDNPDGQKRGIDYDEIIEFQDVERIIYRKLEHCIQELCKPQNVIRSNDEISLREKEVLKLVALGMTNKEIAEKLFISSHTVITHRKNITAKLGIKTIAGLTVYALINKLISADEIK